MDYSIIRLIDRPEIKEEAARWFHEKWRIPLKEYQESMEDVPCYPQGGIKRMHPWGFSYRRKISSPFSPSKNEREGLP